MLTTRSARLLIVVIATMGCSADSTVPDGVSAPRPLLAASGAQQRVTGHANMILPSLGNAEQKYSSSAIRHADGTVSGEFELRTEQTDGGRIHGSVLCFTIVGNTARLAGIVEQSSTPLAVEGVRVVWTVVDNGEGKNDPPDRTSDLFPVGPLSAAFHCATGFALPLLPVVSGNLQVHP